MDNISNVDLDDLYSTLYQMEMGHLTKFDQSQSNGF